MAKTIDQMSAAELYALARKKEEEERRRQEEEARRRIEELRARRKEMVARHRRELAEIDREIRRLEGGGRGRRRRAVAATRRGGALSSRAVEIIAAEGPIDTATLRARLEKEGIDTKNLGQTLSYLKRRGRIVSPRRGVYAAA